MRYVFPVLILATLMGCTNECVVNVDEMPDDGIVLKEFQIIGTFKNDSNNLSITKDYLESLGFSERTVNYQDFASIKPLESLQLYSNKDPESNHFIKLNERYGITTGDTLLRIAYCVVNLKSSKERKLKLNYSNTGHSRVWLNGNLIHDKRWFFRNSQLYDNYLDLNLVEGNNTLMIKILRNKKSNWGFFAALENENEEGFKRFKNSFSVRWSANFLSRAIIINNKISLKHHDISLPSNTYKISVLDVAQNKVLTDTINYQLNNAIDISSLSDGLYRCELSAFNDTFTQMFYKGNLLDTLQKLTHDIFKFKPEGRTRQEIDAVSFRINLLLKPENHTLNSDNWDRKMLLLHMQLQYYYNCLNKKESVSVNAPGYLIRSYNSKIDGSLQYYQVSAPDNIDPQTKMPLFIVSPTLITRQPFYLQNIRFANVDFIDLLNRMANKHRIIIYRPNNRIFDTNPSKTLAEADFWEGLEFLKKDYRIDSSRIYICGECGAGEDILQLAVKNPDKFAAIATVSPLITASDNFNYWLKPQEPTQYLLNIDQMPFINLHGQYNPHTNIKFSDELALKVKNIKLSNFVYRRTNEIGATETEVYLDEILEFCNDKRLNYSPSKVNFSTNQLKNNKSFWVTINSLEADQSPKIEAEIQNNILTIRKKDIHSYSIDLKTLPFAKNKPLKIIDNDKVIFKAIAKGSILTFNAPAKGSLVKSHEIEGPLAHVFTQPFIVVPGTLGDKLENESLQELANEISMKWEGKFYQGCRVKADINITDTDVAESNLILLGSPASNSVFSKIINRLPIKISNSNLVVGSQEAKGKDLCYYLIYPNPLNPQKYVAIIGSNNPKFISLGQEDNTPETTIDISNYGWFDYKIWKADQPDMSLISGYFSNTWK